MSHLRTVSHSSKTCIGVARWGRQLVSAWQSPTASARSYFAARPSACLPNLPPGEHPLVITQGKDALQVEDKYGEVMCRLGTVDDYACDICEKIVANKPILYMTKDQDDSWYENVTCTLCKPCVLAMFTIFEKTAKKGA